MPVTEYVQPGPLGLYSDAARRAADAVNLHLLADRDGAPGKWMLLFLADGSSDGNLYDHKWQAVRHTPATRPAAYLCIPPTGMMPRGAELFLKFNRELHDAGMRMTDPDADREVVMPDRAELYQLVDSQAQQALEREWSQQLAKAAARIDPRMYDALKKAMGL